MAKNGLNMKCYTDDTGGVGDGTWDNQDEMINKITVNQTRNSSAIKRRGNGDETYIRGLRVRSIDMEIVDDPSDPLWLLLHENYESDDPEDYIGIACMNGTLPAVGVASVGLQMDVVVTDFGQSQELEDGSMRKIKLVPSDASDFSPTEATVAVA